MITGPPTVKDVARVIADLYDRWFSVRYSPSLSFTFVSDCILFVTDDEIGISTPKRRRTRGMLVSGRSGGHQVGRTHFAQTIRCFGQLLAGRSSSCWIVAYWMTFRKYCINI